MEDNELVNSKDDKKDEKTVIDLLFVNAQVMEKMIDFKEKEDDKRFKIKIATIVSITVIIVAFLYFISSCEPTTINNTNTQNNAQKNITEERMIDNVEQICTGSQKLFW